MKKKAFSLAEMLIVLCIVTVIMAATMPIISKRAKMHAAAASGSSSNTLACTKTVTSPITNATIGRGVIFYQIAGGGGGKSRYSGTGGGGGSSAILIDGVLQAYSAGGPGTVYYSNPNDANGALSSGAIFLDPSLSSHTISVYVGGGGGGAGMYENPTSGTSNTYGGRGGAGYCGGAEGASGSNPPGNQISTPTPGGGSTCDASLSLKGSAGNTSNGSSVNTLGGGGGGYGGRGGDSGYSYDYNGLLTIPASNGLSAGSTSDDGKGGGTYTDPNHGYTLPAGGDGGYVTLYFMTNASSCPSW